MNQDKRDIRELTKAEIFEYVIQNNLKNFRCNQIFEWIWKKGAHCFDEMTNIPLELRKTLANDFFFPVIQVVSLSKSKDGTLKMLFELPDKNYVEGVIIPANTRSTACISTQAGCPLNCSFCATGNMGFQRNLCVGEIFDQFLLLNQYSVKETGNALSNFVLMGMGEPLLNYENVVRALRMITSSESLGISPGRITLSTVGIVDKVKMLAEENLSVRLAVSLHTANTAKRNRIIPANKKNNLPALAESLRYFYAKTSLRITIEYLLLKDFNDSIKDADELLEFCKNFPCKINLIEYNQTTHSEFEKSGQKTILKFRDKLAGANLPVNIRNSRGGDIDAGCGQLANKNKNKS